MTIVSEKEPFFEITATDPAGIAEQQAVIDAFNQADEVLASLEETCEEMDRMLDRKGARRITEEEAFQFREEAFAMAQRDRERREKRKSKMK